MHFLISPIVLLITIGLYKLLSVVISKILWNKFSLFKDIHLLSKARPKHDKLPGTAVICGGSIAGMFAARVCANHFEKVYIIEPEQWVANGEGLKDNHRDANSLKRSRVAQYKAYHHYQLLITAAMKEMFSNFEQAIQSVGGRLTICSRVFWLSGFPMLIPSGFPYYSDGVYPPAINATRPVFETTLRRLLLQTCKEVQYIHGTVTGLLYNESVNGVTGVSARLPNGETIKLQGSLVVDATGSFMGGFRWLKDIPKFASSHSPSLDDLKISFDPKVSYVGCEFELSPKLEKDFRKYGLPMDGDQDGRLSASLPMDGINNNILAIEKRERNILQMGCGGYDWHGKIRSLSDIEDFVRQLKLKQPLPDWISEMLHTLQSEGVFGSFADYKYPLSVYIKYHEANDLPSNFVVIGDAISQTDPILGQGCTKACANAVILNAQLHNTIVDSAGLLPHTFAKTYFLDVKTRTEHIWETMKNIDYNFPSTVPVSGENLQTTSWFMRTYTNIFMALAAKARDADVSGAFYRQTAWMDLPTDTFAPWLVRRIMWAWIKQLCGYEIL